MLTPEKAAELRESMRKTYVDLVKVLFKIGQGDERWVRGITEQWFAQGKEASVREPNKGFENDPGVKQQLGAAEQKTAGPGAMTIDEAYALLINPDHLDRQGAQRLDKAFVRLLMGLYIFMKCDEKAFRGEVDEKINEALRAFVTDVLLHGVKNQTAQMEADNKLKQEGLERAKKAIGGA